MSKNNFIERIAIALEEQNKTLKKIHVALNGTSGNLIQHTRTIKESLESVGERLPFVSNAITDEIAELTTELMEMNDKKNK